MKKIAVLGTFLLLAAGVLLFAQGNGTVSEPARNSSDAAVGSTLQVTEGSQMQQSSAAAASAQTVQNGADETAPAATYTQKDLDTALAPIALYPDPLLAQVLMAATYPDQLQAAWEWRKAQGKLAAEKILEKAGKQPWDPSVVALTAFPEVLEMLTGKQEWTQQLGEMFLTDPDRVMDTIQSLRKKAQEAGNLKSSKEQSVRVEENTIIIEPADPQVIYVPVYDPGWIFGPWWYAEPPFFYYPPHYHHPNRDHFFGLYAVLGAVHALWCHWDWHRHDIYINHHHHYYPHPIPGHAKPLSWRHQLLPKNPHLKEMQKKVAPTVLQPDSREMRRKAAQEKLERRGGTQLKQAQETLKKHPEAIRKQISKPTVKPAVQSKPAPKPAVRPKPAAKPKPAARPKPAVKPQPRPMPKPKPSIRPKPMPRPMPKPRPMPAIRPSMHMTPHSMGGGGARVGGLHR